MLQLETSLLQDIVRIIVPEIDPKNIEAFEKRTPVRRAKNHVTASKHGKRN